MKLNEKEKEKDIDSDNDTEQEENIFESEKSLKNYWPEYRISRQSKWDQANGICKYFPFFILPLIWKLKTQLISSSSSPSHSHSSDYQQKNNDTRKKKKKKRKSHIHLLTNYETTNAEDESKHLGFKLRIKYEMSKCQIGYTKSSSFQLNLLLKALVGLFKSKLISICLLQFLAFCVIYPIQVVSFGWLIEDLELYLRRTRKEEREINGDEVEIIEEEKWIMINWGPIVTDIVLLGMSLLLYNLVDSVYRQMASHLALKCRVSVSHLIYMKSLRLSSIVTLRYNNNNNNNNKNQNKTEIESRNNDHVDEFNCKKIIEETNKLVKMLSLFDDFVPISMTILIVPIQAIILFTLLAWLYVGLYPTLITILAFTVCLILQTLSGLLSASYSEKLFISRRERLYLINEIFESIKQVKMSTWPLKSLENLVSEARYKELKFVKYLGFLKGFNYILYHTAQRIITFITLISLIFFTLDINDNDNEERTTTTTTTSRLINLTPKVAFLTLFINNAIRISLTHLLPKAVSLWAEILVLSHRIDTFIQLEPEHVNYRPINNNNNNNKWNLMNEKNKNKNKKQESSVIVSNVSIHLTVNQHTRLALLRDISFTLESSDLLLVLGCSGSGKSMLLLTLLGEYPIEEPSKIELNGQVSFAPQKPWILTGSTIRENILLGRVLDPIRYDKVLKVCLIDKDLELLPWADKTPIGESGFSLLSDEQKVRIGLARSLYQEADIYLLDDPFSPLEATVAGHIFDQAIRGFLREKTVILATHQIKFAQSSSSKILLLERPNQDEKMMFDEENSSEKRIHSENQWKWFGPMSLLEPKKLGPAVGVNEAQGRGEEKGEKQTRVRASRELDIKLFEDGNIKEMSIANIAGIGASNKIKIADIADDIDALFRAKAKVNAKDGSRWNRNSNNINSIRNIIDVHGYSSNSNSNSSGSGNSNSNNNNKSISISCRSEQKKRVEESRRNHRLAIEEMNKKRQQRQSSSSIFYGLTFYFNSLATFPIRLILLPLVALVTYIVPIFSDYALSCWSNDDAAKSMNSNSNSNNNNNSNNNDNLMDDRENDRMYWFIIYLALIALVLILTSIYTLSFFFSTLRASKCIHRKLFNGLTRAPLNQIDFRPHTSIMNHFANDITAIDDFVPFKLITFTQTTLSILITTSVVTLLSGNSLCWIIKVSFEFFLLLIRQLFSQSIRFIKINESLAQDSILSHLSVTLAGLTSIRALKLEQQFICQFEIYLNEHSSKWFALIAATRLVCLLVNLVSLAYIVSVILIILPGLSELQPFEGSPNIEIGQIALAIFLLLDFPHFLQAGISQSIELECQMLNLATVRELSELKPELEMNENELDVYSLAAINIANQKLNYSNDGGNDIKLTDVTMKYFELPVLVNINLSIEAGEKILILGPSGSGKQSLIGALFRLYPFEGSIELAGLDSKHMSLRQLRNSIGILTNRPILFNTSLRKNLDPLERYSDGRIWKALDIVKLSSFVRDTSKNPLGLNMTIEPKGANLSIGQRQLVCLARVILKRNRILILYKATQNVDKTSETKMRDAIEREFSNRTVLTIGHRIRSVIDTDKVLLMESGRVLEFGQPYKLTLDRLSRLNVLLDSSSDGNELRSQIEKKYKLKSSGPISK